MPYTFPIEKQEEDSWCWAAVAVSVAHYFDPGSQQSQCRVAKQVIGGDCCNNKPSCNQPSTLTAALTAVGRFRPPVEGPLTFEATQSELDANRPVCARIGWDGGGGHFVVLSGYRVSAGGIRLVQVSDPFYPDSTVEYGEFLAAYHGDGQWTHTYLVTM